MYVEIWDDIDILKDVKMISFLALSFATLEKVDLALCHHLGGAVDGPTSDVVWGPQFHPVGGVGSPKLRNLKGLLSFDLLFFCHGSVLVFLGVVDCLSYYL